MTEHDRDTIATSGTNGVSPTTAPPVPPRPTPPPTPRPHRQGDTPTPPRGQPVIPPQPPTPAPTPPVRRPDDDTDTPGARHAAPPMAPPQVPGWGHVLGPQPPTGGQAPAPGGEPSGPRPPAPTPPPWQPDRGQAPGETAPPAPTPPAPPAPDQQPRPHNSGPIPAPGSFSWGVQPGTPGGPPRPDWRPAGAPAPSPPPQAPSPSPAPSPVPGPHGQWNYTDSLRQGELVPTRKIPPSRGWRRAFHLMTFKLINPGRSADERRQHELEAKVRSLLRGHYKIGVLGKGGVGKTTVAAAVGSQMALLRQDDRVVAIDADTAFGKLGGRIDPDAHGSYWELAADNYLHSFTDVRARVGSNSAGLFVLPGEPSARRRRVLDPAIYRQATAQLDRHFTVSIVDCGSTMDAQVTEEVLKDLDALIVVTTPWFDAVSAAGQTLEWLADKGHTALLHRTVVVINDSDGRGEKKTRSHLGEQFSRRGHTVVEFPYDQHLRPGGVVDIVNELDPVTRRRVLEVAASIAEHFAATTDGPRDRR